ncbi:MAG: AzlC family ABC transporter permease [Lachnospiraceae bacterium]
MKQEFKQGMQDSIPIALGYFSVSFTFGILAASEGMSPWLAGLISLTNVTSAGQFAGLHMIMTQASYFEMFVTQFVINLRYALMSLALSQKLSQKATTGKRMLMAFCNTDEIFAVAVSKTKPITPCYMAGLETLPITTWTLGTIVGAIATDLMPASMQSALGLALYGMFIAIVIPPAREHRAIAVVAVVALSLSCLIYYTPLSKWISSGFSIILCTVIAAGMGAYFFPLGERNEKDEKEQVEKALETAGERKK